MHPALSHEALYGKSKRYVVRALRCKSNGDFDEYQLWASLALELLGKACLARRHPSLIANPMSSHSLFAASGIRTGIDITTISSKTMVCRLRVVVSGFDRDVEKHCHNIFTRRNMELHSGELPYKSMTPSAWEVRFWHATDAILRDMDQSLNDWLGVSRAKAPTELLKHAHQAIVYATKVKIENAHKAFSKMKKAVKEKLLRNADGKQPYHYNNVFAVDTDFEHMVECPACTGNAIVAGDLVDEIPQDVGDEFDPWEETVEKCYVAHEFFCPVCQLRLNSLAELEAAGVQTDFLKIGTRERYPEPDYGND